MTESHAQIARILFPGMTSTLPRVYTRDMGRIVSYICQRCGQEFQRVWDRPRKYCSRSCQARAIVEQRGADVLYAQLVPTVEARRGRIDYKKKQAKWHRAGRRLVEETRHAPRNGYEWTGPELEIAARTDLTAIEVAHMLGRTAYAVKHMRRKLVVDPRKQAAL